MARTARSATSVPSAVNPREGPLTRVRADALGARGIASILTDPTEPGNSAYSERSVAERFLDVEGGIVGVCAAQAHRNAEVFRAGPLAHVRNVRRQKDTELTLAGFDGQLEIERQLSDGAAVD